VPEPGGGELEEREQAVRLGLVRDDSRQDPGEPDRLAGEVGADQLGAGRGRRPLGEDQVQHAEHRGEPGTPLVHGRHLERHLRGREGSLGPGDPSLHGGGLYQEHPGDLLAGQAAEHTQRERDAGLPGQDRVAGDEHQRQHVVVDPVGVPQQVGVRPRALR